MAFWPYPKNQQQKNAKQVGVEQVRSIAIWFTVRAPALAYQKTPKIAVSETGKIPQRVGR